MHQAQMEERKAKIQLKYENKDKPKDVRKDYKLAMNDDKTDLESRGSRMQQDESFFGKSIPMSVMRAQSVMPPTIKQQSQLGHTYNKQHSAMDAMLIGNNNRPRF